MKPGQKEQDLFQIAPDQTNLTGADLSGANLTRAILDLMAQRIGPRSNTPA